MHRPSTLRTHFISASLLGGLLHPLSMRVQASSTGAPRAGQRLPRTRGCPAGKQGGRDWHYRTHATPHTHRLPLPPPRYSYASTAAQSLAPALLQARASHLSRKAYGCALSAQASPLRRCFAMGHALFLYEHCCLPNPHALSRRAGATSRHLYAGALRHAHTALFRWRTWREQQASGTSPSSSSAPAGTRARACSRCHANQEGGRSKAETGEGRGMDDIKTERAGSNNKHMM